MCHLFLRRLQFMAEVPEKERVATVPTTMKDPSGIGTPSTPRTPWVEHPSVLFLPPHGHSLGHYPLYSQYLLWPEGQRIEIFIAVKSGNLVHEIIMVDIVKNGKSDLLVRCTLLRRKGYCFPNRSSKSFESAHQREAKCLSSSSPVGWELDSDSKMKLHLILFSPIFSLISSWHL